MTDNMIDALTRIPSRRDVLRGLVGAGLGLALTRLPDRAEAKRKRKKPPRKARPNAFGCLEVGDACQSAGQCCSGVCEGKKGKRTCRAHGAGTCSQQGFGACTAPNPGALRCNNEVNCGCLHTTAGSNFCADLNNFSSKICADCAKDADCEALGFPRGSACVPISEGICAGTCESGMACMPPCGTELPDPETP